MNDAHDPAASGGPDRPGAPGRTPCDLNSPDRVPLPRPASDAAPAPDEPGDASPPLAHHRLKTLLAAWALTACSPQENAAVERHLERCTACAEEAARLRNAVPLLTPAESLDLDPALRTRALEAGLRRRAPRVPVPGWATPYDAETARLDALLQDISAHEWHAPVELRWYDAGSGTPAVRRASVTAVLGHLLAVDGLVAVALGLPDPLPAPAPRDPEARTRRYWSAAHPSPASAVREPWREQSHRLVRTASFTARTATGTTDAWPAADGYDGEDTAAAVPVPYGSFTLPLADALLDRAFECWVHASDIATAVDYPYAPPVPRHMRRIIDFTARRLPGTLTGTRRGGTARGPHPDPDVLRLPARGGQRVLRLEVEGAAGGEWLVALDDPAGTGAWGARREPVADGREVAHIALDDFEFCRLAAGHVSPEEAAAGSTGDGTAIRTVLTAVSRLSRL